MCCNSIFKLKLTLEFFHQLHRKVLVSNVQYKAWLGLEDSLGQVVLMEEIDGLVSIPHVMLVDEVERIPLPMHVGRAGL